MIPALAGLITFTVLQVLFLHLRCHDLHKRIERLEWRR